MFGRFGSVPSSTQHDFCSFLILLYRICSRSLQEPKIATRLAMHLVFDLEMQVLKGLVLAHRAQWLPPAIHPQPKQGPNKHRIAFNSALFGPYLGLGGCMDGSSTRLYD